MSRAESISKEARLTLIKKRHQFSLSQSREISLPTLNELPQADTTDLEQAYQYQRTIDEDFES